MPMTKHTAAARTVLAALIVPAAAALTSASAFARDATALAIELQERIAAEPAFELVVAVPEGESVVLTGAVASDEEKALLDELVSSVEDAGDVDNQVAVR